MSDKLIRFWFEFDHAVATPVGFRLGCGVTAKSETDARALLDLVWPVSANKPAIAKILVGIERDDLERNHVQPNVGDLNVRGVWFPNFGPVS